MTFLHHPRFFLSIWKFRIFLKYLKRRERERDWETLRNGEKHTSKKASHIHRRSAYLVGSPSVWISVHRFRRSLSPGTNFLSLSLSQVKNVLLGLFTFTHCVCICLHSQPSDKISKVLHGGQLTDEEAQSLLKK